MSSDEDGRGGRPGACPESRRPPVTVLTGTPSGWTSRPVHPSPVYSGCPSFEGLNRGPSTGVVRPLPGRSFHPGRSQTAPFTGPTMDGLGSPNETPSLPLSALVQAVYFLLSYMTPFGSGCLSFRNGFRCVPFPSSRPPVWVGGLDTGRGRTGWRPRCDHDPRDVRTFTSETYILRVRVFGCSLYVPLP